MITPIWGSNYINRWFELSFPALRSPGNIPYMNEHCDFELAILSKYPQPTLLWPELIIPFQIRVLSA